MEQHIERINNLLNSPYEGAPSEATAESALCVLGECEIVGTLPHLINPLEEDCMLFEWFYGADHLSIDVYANDQHIYCESISGETTRIIEIWTDEELRSILEWIKSYEQRNKSI